MLILTELNVLNVLHVFNCHFILFFSVRIKILLLYGHNNYLPVMQNYAWVQQEFSHAFSVQLTFLLKTKISP